MRPPQGAVYVHYHDELLMLVPAEGIEEMFNDIHAGKFVPFNHVDTTFVDRGGTERVKTVEDEMIYLNPAHIISVKY